MLVLSSALMFTGCNVEKMSTLRDISRPYAGEYKCSRLQLGGEDLLPQMKYLKLKLGYYGDFCVTYADFAGGAGEYSGTYRMEDGAVVLHADAGGEEKKYVFPFENGTLYITLLFGGKPLEAEFRTP